MNIAVTGEGSTDYGKAVYGSPGQWKEGPVQVYLRKIAAEEGIGIDLDMVDRAELTKVKLQRKQLTGIGGKSVPARRFYVYCRNNG